MKKITLLGLFIFSLVCLKAQIIFQEDFEEGQLPSGWMIETNATDGGWNFGPVGPISSNGFGIPANGSSNIAGTNDDQCNCDKSNDLLITPPIDLGTQTAASLKYDIFYTDNAYQNDQENATVEISIDGGSTWEVIEDIAGETEWVTHGINISDYVGQSVLIGFRYNDGSGWLYGAAIDNVLVEVPAALDVELTKITSPTFGETGAAIPIKGEVYNIGSNTVTSLDISYSVNGGTPVSELLDNLSIASFSYYSFELANPYQATAADNYVIDVTINQVNGGMDENPDNNSGSFESEIFEEVIIENKIDDFLNSPSPDISEITGASSLLNKPTDLDFFPILGKDELWVISEETEDAGGSTVTIADAVAGPSDFDLRNDANNWHFMSLPTAIAFSTENFNFATSPGVQDANHGGGTFTGPTLWSSDPDIYAMPSGGNGSHIDMLHGSPFSMGIAHEVDNVFWVYDDWNSDIVRYDFVDDHGPGADYHGDALVRRYQDIGISADADIPNHMIVDKTTGWLYFVDNGNDRIVRLDINSGSGMTNLPLINEALEEHSRVNDFVFEVVIDAGLDRPCGIEIIENRLLVGDYATGDIIVFDMDNDFAELGVIPTGDEGLTGIKVGPDGNIWFTNKLLNTVSIASPGEPTSTSDIDTNVRVNVSPNPTDGRLNVRISALNSDVSIRLTDITGKEVLNRLMTTTLQQLDLSELPGGVYLLNVQGASFSTTEKVVLDR